MTSRKLVSISLAVILGLSTLAVALLYDETWAIFAIPILLLSPIVAMAFLIVGVAQIKRKKYLLGGFQFAACLSTLAALGVPWVRPGLADFSASYLKVSLNEREYRREIFAVKPDESGHKYKEFNWGGFMLNPVKLVYDESDELALPIEKRSATWKERTKNSEFAKCHYAAKNIKSHFYVVKFGC